MFNYIQIIDFLLNSSIDEIVKNFYDKIKCNKYCNLKLDNYLSEGFFGKVYKPRKRFKFRLEDKIIKLPIIVKEVKNFDKSNIEFKIVNNVLYIIGTNTITTETLILIFIRRLWDKTVHLPLLLGYGTCSETKNINRLITLYYGLKHNYTFKLYNNILATHINPRDLKFDSRLNTLNDLFIYLYHNKKKNELVELPNGINCNIIKLFDYFCISHLITYHLLIENNIYISDMNSYNIFIHWLNKKSYYNNKKIKNLKEIIYKIDNKYYKIETYGLLLIFGDLGSSIIKMNNVIIFGNLTNSNKIKYIDLLLKPEIFNIEFMRKNYVYLTLEEYKQTIAYKILTLDEYADIPINKDLFYGYKYSNINKFKSTIELLSFFNKYEISEFKKAEDNILIEIKKYN